MSALDKLGARIRGGGERARAALLGRLQVPGADRPPAPERTAGPGERTADLPPAQESAELQRARAGHFVADAPAAEIGPDSSPGSLRDPGRPWVLLTFNEYETQAVLRRFRGEAAVPELQERGGVLYRRLGSVQARDGSGRENVLLVTAGRQGPLSASDITGRVCRAFSPRAVIAVGVAFGVRDAHVEPNEEKRQAIGDVLISDRVIDYSLTKEGTDNRGQLEVKVRGGEPSASADLLELFTAADHAAPLYHHPAWPRIETGAILSGPKLVDNLDYREALKALYDNHNIVGGEMEGLGLAQAVSAPDVAVRVSWIVVKAICDFADGQKGANKAERQQKAATAAVEVVYSALTDFEDRLRDDDREVGAIDQTPPDAPGSVDRFLQPRLGDLKGIPDDRFLVSQAMVLEYNSMAVPERPRQATAKDKPILADLADWAADEAAERIFALFGEYGMGKTVTCQAFAEAQLARRAQDPSARLALYFNLRHVTELALLPTVDSVMLQCVRGGLNRDGEVTLDDLWRWIDGGAIVIFDGLDEVLVKLRDDQDQELTDRLLSVLDKARPAGGRSPRVLITARTQFFRSFQEMLDRPSGSQRGNKLPRQFRARQLLPLSDEQIRVYLAAVLPGRDVPRVLAMIRSVHDLADLTGRPFTLGLVAEVVPRIEALRAEGKPVLGSTLYREFAHKWLARDDPKHLLGVSHKLDLVQELAAELWRRQVTELPVSKLQEWVSRWGPRQSYWEDVYGAEIRQDPAAWRHKLDEDLRNSTFLSRVDLTATEGAFGFAHTSLQEFFLSEYLLQALRNDVPERWAMRTPSSETLNFLGQSLLEFGGARELATMARWFRGDDRAVNSVILQYRWWTSVKDWPQVDLSVQFVDQGATSDVIAPGEKVLLGGNVWRVLKVDPKAGTALLLSEHVVAYRPYHNEFKDVVWKKCSLRKWLNGEFFPSLPADFAEMVVETRNENPKSRRDVSGGPATWDKVFILSPQEALTYFNKNDDTTRIARRHDGETWWWWLRSPGDNGNNAAGVNYDGNVYDGWIDVI
ncbi:MAG: DUF6273 domain-containing protein, partial [Propionibacteriaceae bacterium]|nr:DUF6273 domain-containing protein [Propionibacteriaceae bacterium]